MVGFTYCWVVVIYWHGLLLQQGPRTPSGHGVLQGAHEGGVKEICGMIFQEPSGIVQHDNSNPIAWLDSHIACLLVVIYCPGLLSQVPRTPLWHAVMQSAY
jgi:hypothetical protein